MSAHDRLCKQLVSRVKLAEVNAILSMEGLKRSTILPLPKILEEDKKRPNILR